MTDILSDAEAERLKIKTVVRLRTSMWSDKKGVHVKRSLTYLRRLSTGFNVLEEEVAAVGAEDAIGIVINLCECKDGIYQIITCNESRDWETGYIDSYDLKLVPLPQPPEPPKQEGS